MIDKKEIEMNLKKKTKICATLGPASNNPKTILELFNSGANMFRLNFSHGSYEWHEKIIKDIRSLNIPVAIMMDTKGPEIRTGEIKNGISVKEGDKIILTIKDGIYEETNKISVSYKGFINDVNEGDLITIDSGKAIAKAIKKQNEDIEFEIIEGKCKITTKRHINLKGKPVNLPTLSSEDYKDIDFALSQNVECLALSFVRNEKDIKEAKDYIKSKGKKCEIYSKIESYESTINLESIIENSDGIIFARGDLACETSFEDLPILQKKVCSLCSYYNKPICIATQMLISMKENYRPTRAEISDVANSVFDGVDSVMTSDETAEGKRPVHTINTMSKILKETEMNLYSNCDRPDCDDCFGIVHRGRIMRSGFETITFMRQKKIEKTKKKITLKRKFSCNGLNMRKNSFVENMINILPFITDDLDCIITINNFDDGEYMKNVSASRINIPMFAFCNNESLANLLNFVWNVRSIYDKRIQNDFFKNIEIIDEFIEENLMKKYLLIADLTPDGKNTMIQVRTI